MRKQRMKKCFFAMTLCCVAGSMYAQSAQDGSKTAEKKSSVKGKKIQKSKFSDDPIELNNVVVTALGIKREEKSLGYATQTVSGSDITATMPTNWSQALQGQVAGLNVISAGGPLSSTQINLRGNVSMNMDGNGALIVVDGVPLSSPMNNPGGSYGAGGNSEGSIDFGNGFSEHSKVFRSAFLAKLVNRKRKRHRPRYIDRAVGFETFLDSVSYLRDKIVFYFCHGAVHNAFRHRDIAEQLHLDRGRLVILNNIFGIPDYLIAAFFVILF